MTPRNELVPPVTIGKLIDYKPLTNLVEQMLVTEHNADIEASSKYSIHPHGHVSNTGTYIYIVLKDCDVKPMFEELCRDLKALGYRADLSIDDYGRPHIFVRV